ncbi:THAP domain-containing protein 4 [Trachymyrmex zeteki]|uniref:THAP domain-containing protein 4 n=1 Tax=Mycetomoellerius zeteki TaxID=64791 RepID=A0A151WKW8_9HYME|nr:THAP domain-containing protein 4 [Trachymyrmex zeteki]
MPGCCVDLCKNRTEKGARLFRLPTGKRNSERRLEWLRLIEKNTLPERAVICEAHFGEDQFENKREDERKLLRPFAKPNLLEKHTIEAKNQLTEKVSRSVEIEIYDKQNPININCTSLCNDSNSHTNEDNSNNMTNNIGTNVVDESQNTPLIKKKDKDIRKLKKALQKKKRM